MCSTRPERSWSESAAFLQQMTQAKLLFWRQVFDRVRRPGKCDDFPAALVNIWVGTAAQRLEPFSHGRPKDHIQLNEGSPISSKKALFVEVLMFSLKRSLIWLVFKISCTSEPLSIDLLLTTSYIFGGAFFCWLCGAEMISWCTPHCLRLKTAKGVPSYDDFRWPFQTYEFTAILSTFQGKIHVAAKAFEEKEKASVFVLLPSGC